MKRLLCALMVFACLMGQAEELPFTYSLYVDEEPSADRDGYWYVSGGFAAVVPKVSLGYRFQRGKFGGDVSVTEAALPPRLFSQGVQLNQLYYPNPNLKRQWYWGMSEGVHYLFGSDVGGAWDVSLGALGGFQFKTAKRRHFIEGKLGIPLILSKNGARYPVPIPSIAYGVSF